MTRFYQIGMLMLLLNFSNGCSEQMADANHHMAPSSRKTIVGGGCDGCEIMYIGMPESIHSIDTSDGWHEEGQKLLITGKVFKKDWVTLARDVVVYYWQTDNNGYYSPKEGMYEKAKRHGHIRGWVKSDENGSYSIYTIRPAPYPNEDMPAHIHLSIKEPEVKNEYYIDEFVFDDDELLTEEKRKALENRGGSGILTPVLSGSLQVAEHSIVVGMNIPDYPKD